MGMGSNLVVEDAEEKYREKCANYIANIAAQRVAARDSTRSKAIAEAVEHMSALSDAENDPTGTLSSLGITQVPEPSRAISDAQRAAIAQEMIDRARDAVGAGGQFQA